MFESRDTFGFEYQLHDGSTMRMHHHFGGNTGMPVAIQTWVIPPGGYEGFHKHEEDLPLQEFYQVIEGTARVRLEDEIYVLSAGDSILASAGVNHDLRNIGEGELRVLVIWGPPGQFDMSSFGSHQRSMALRAAADHE